MFIEELTMVGYKRFMLRNIKTLNVKMSSIHQIILGTNGSGKSSLMSELIRLVPSGSDYIKGGSKTIRFPHRGSNYMLHSDFSLAAGKHTFEKDGVKLNDAGTAMVQKELVKQHLGLDETLMKIMTGESKFSNMSPLQRREVLIAMSECDLDYAMVIWNKLKARLRDMQGVLKHLNGRIAQESDKMPSGEQLAEMKGQVNHLRDLLTLLMEHKEANLPRRQQLKGEIDGLLGVITNLSNKMLMMSIDKPNVPGVSAVQTLGDVKEIIHGLSEKLASADALLAHNLNEQEKVHEIVEALRLSHASGIDELELKLKDARLRQDEYRQQIRQFHETPEPNALQATDAIYHDVAEIFSHMPINDKRLYTRDRREKALESHTAIRNEIERLQRDLGRFEHRLEHIRKTDDTVCPQCKHSWVPGVMPGEEKELLRNLEKGTGMLKGYTDKKERLERFLEDVKIFSDYYRRFQRFVETSPSMQPFWDYCLEEERIFNNPRGLGLALTVWQEDLRHHAAITQLESECHLYEEAIRKTAELGGEKHYAEQISRLSGNIESATQSVDKYRRQLSDVKRYHNDLMNLLAGKLQLDDFNHSLRQKVELLTRIVRRDIIDAEIREKQSQLALHEQTLTTATTLEGIITDLTKSLDEAILDHEAFKTLAEALSPTEGLIADQLRGFIQCFVDQLNDIISQVWTYDMVVLPCGMNDGELDYKFPLSVKDSDNPAPDISYGSTGQVEMIDFAFKVVTQLYFDMADYPLFMDELGPHFDDQHRINVMRFVQTLVEARKCSQMFLVSHYAASHGVFTNAEVLVLDDKNVVLPGAWNTHVTFG